MSPSPPPQLCHVPPPTIFGVQYKYAAVSLYNFPQPLPLPPLNPKYLPQNNFFSIFSAYFPLSLSVYYYYYYYYYYYLAGCMTFLSLSLYIIIIIIIIII